MRASSHVAARRADARKWQQKTLIDKGNARAYGAQTLVITGVPSRNGKFCTLRSQEPADRLRRLAISLLLTPSWWSLRTSSAWRRTVTGRP